MQCRCVAALAGPELFASRRKAGQSAEPPWYGPVCPAVLGSCIANDGKQAELQERDSQPITAGRLLGALARLGG